MPEEFSRLAESLPLPTLDAKKSGYPSLPYGNILDNTADWLRAVAYRSQGAGGTTDLRRAPSL